MINFCYAFSKGNSHCFIPDFSQSIGTGVQSCELGDLALFVLWVVALTFHLHGAMWEEIGFEILLKN